MRILSILTLCLFSTATQAFNEADDKALAEVQALLQNPQVLNGPAGNQKEKAALAEIEKLTQGNPKAQQEIHQLSSDIFTDLVKKNGAGEDAIMKSLLEAQQDPAKFMRTLSPEQQRKLRELASEMDEKNGQTGKQK